MSFDRLKILYNNSRWWYHEYATFNNGPNLKAILRLQCEVWCCPKILDIWRRPVLGTPESKYYVNLLPHEERHEVDEFEDIPTAEKEPVQELHFFQCTSALEDHVDFKKEFYFPGQVPDSSLYPEAMSMNRV